MDRMTLLVPVYFPRDEPLTDANVQGLTGFDIVLFGYWRTPEGADPDVIRESHAVEAKAELYDLAAQFSRAGASTSVQFHVGEPGADVHARQEELAREVGADAVVIPNEITLWNNVFVPLRDDRNARRIVDFLTAFDQDTIFTLELYHVATDQRDVEAAREMLAGVETMLYERGFTESDLEVTVVVAPDPEAAIIERAGRHNVVVIGASEEHDGPARFLGETYERIADQTAVPVVVVRDTP